MATALLVHTVAALAFGPYTTGQVGYDVSYPNCSAKPVGGFGIIGVNDGRPFTLNPCFGSEYERGANSAYINTAYARAYMSNIATACESGGDQAWQIGCSEAEYSLAHVSVAPSMWWLDVETANSWSSAKLNRDTIQGAIDRLVSVSGVPVGVYSTGPAWKKITGGTFVPDGVAGDWLPAPACSGATPFMPGTNVWLIQAISHGLDVDTAC